MLKEIKAADKITHVTPTYKKNQTVLSRKKA